MTAKLTTRQRDAAFLAAIGLERMHAQAILTDIIQALRDKVTVLNHGLVYGWSSVAGYFQHDGHDYEFNVYIQNNRLWYYVSDSADVRRGTDIRGAALDSPSGIMAEALIDLAREVNAPFLPAMERPSQYELPVSFSRDAIDARQRNRHHVPVGHVG